MQKPLVTAVIPTYNYGCFILEAVESALRQSYENVEIIVVDDGSTDDTFDRLTPYRSRIRYIRQENQGLSAARNAGIRAARGEFIALLDSDDVWHPRKLDLQMRYVLEQPEVGLVGTGEVTDFRGEWPLFPGATSFAWQPVGLKALVIHSQFAPSSVVIRKQCFEAVGLFDTGLPSVEDRDMWIRMASRFPVAKLALPLVRYRIHDGSMSKKAARMEECERKVLRQAFARIPSLKGRLLLRLKAFSYAAYAASYMYRSGGMKFRALSRLLRSFVLWPVPYARSEVRMAMARPRMLAVNLIQLAYPRLWEQAH